MSPEPSQPREVAGPTAAPRPAPRDLLRAAGHPAIVILAIAGVMSMLSDTRVVDGLVLVLMATVLTWDGARPRVAGPGRRSGPVAALRRAIGAAPAWAAIGAGAVLALLAGEFARYSWPQTVVVWTLAALAVLICWPPLPTEPDPLPRNGLHWWTGWAVALGLWELAALLNQPNLMTGSPSRPTVSVLMDPVLATYPGRITVFALWLGAGWWLVRRAVR
jgi:hypothetical protein